METGVTNTESMPPIEAEESTATAGSPPADSSEEVPHARGPPVVGVEDLGLQDGHGVEMTLGEQDTQVGGSDGPGDAHPQASTSESSPSDKDGDIILEETPAKEENKPEDTTAAESTKASET